MEHSQSLFDNVKVCENCKRPLPYNYTEALCPRCLDMMLFREVKEYIRTHDVNEYDVAQHFNIPLRQVKNWIKEGRIEDKPQKPVPPSKGFTVSAAVLLSALVPFVQNAFAC